jgi:hypothetical protein
MSTHDPSGAIVNRKSSSVGPVFLTLKGPCSIKIPLSEFAPGPPLIQITTGAV